MIGYSQQQHYHSSLKYSNKYGQVYSIILLGSSNAGKTSIASQIVSHSVDNQYKHTYDMKMYAASIVPLMRSLSNQYEMSDNNNNNKNKMILNINDTNGKRYQPYNNNNNNNNSNNKIQQQYGVQIHDTPGSSDEFSDRLLPEELFMIKSLGYGGDDDDNEDNDNGNNGNDNGDNNGNNNNNNNNNNRNASNQFDLSNNSEQQPLLIGSSSPNGGIGSSSYNRHYSRNSPNSLFKEYQPMGAIVVFDLSRRKSFEKGKKFIDAIQKTIRTKRQAIPIIMFGNKIDLCKDQGGEILKSAKEYCKKYSIPLYYGSVLQNRIYRQDGNNAPFSLSSSSLPLSAAGMSLSSNYVLSVNDMISELIEDIKEEGSDLFMQAESDLSQLQDNNNNGNNGNGNCWSSFISCLCCSCCCSRDKNGNNDNNNINNNNGNNNNNNGNNNPSASHTSNGKKKYLGSGRNNIDTDSKRS